MPAALSLLSFTFATPLVVANDNRTPTGIMNSGIREIVLEAKVAKWLPDDGAESAVTVQAFAAIDGTPRIPGPLVRVMQGTMVRATIINSVPDSTLVLRGLLHTDSVVVPSGERRVVEFSADSPGTFIYWATTTHTPQDGRTGHDSQLTGAIVVDPRGVPVDRSERIFVMTLRELLPDTLAGGEEEFDVAINGKSWPFTETTHYTVGDTVRWRWVNGTDRSHPMHLHGFHFGRLAKGNGYADTTYTGDIPLQVTELMRTGSTMRMDFVPTRAGNWLFHCHMAAHISPFPERPDSVREHDGHEPAAHARNSMSGLVMAIKVGPRKRDGATYIGPANDKETPARALRLLVQQAPLELRAPSDTMPQRPAPRSFVLQRGADPRPDSVEVPGSPIILTRGERVAITVVNRLPQHTTVHWHGMELDGYFDGVAGFSGADARTSPLVAPGDSFTVMFTPPRAGTYLYHSHMDEEPQLAFGMYGTMLILEPGETYDPETDLSFVIGGRASTPGGATVNGLRSFSPKELKAGQTYRLRITNIMSNAPFAVRLLSDSATLTWKAHAKDGADLPASRRTSGASFVILGVGETYDFLWTPDKPMRVVMDVRVAGVPQPLRLLPFLVR
ncbi:MAG: multicopper oxidase domain-containing protein [Gemmatimonadaceae bacterium]